MENRSKDIYVWGAGEVGSFLTKQYGRELNVVGVVDSFSADAELNGFPIMRFGDISCKDNIFVIISVTDENAENSIIKELLDSGLKERVDFCRFFEASNIIFECTGVLFQSYVEQYITDYCTLKCQSCSQFIPYISNPDHIETNALFTDIDRYFSFVDFVRIFRLLGGEPFLHPHLTDIIKYLYDKYEDRYQKLVIVSNGSIIPQKDVMEVIKLCDVHIAISEYGISFVDKRRAELINKLEEEGISYEVCSMPIWYDFCADDVTIAERNDADIVELYKKCDIRCRSLCEGMIWCCAMDAAAYRSGRIDNMTNEYAVSLSHAKKNEVVDKIIGFDQKRIMGGTPAFCGLCNGIGPVNTKQIPVAKQL